MAFTFELVNCKQPITDEYKAWVPDWWYHSSGFPLKTGELTSDYQWLLVGSFLKEEPSLVVNRFLKYRDIETLFNADGQFLLAIYDKSNKSVKLYRDRTGILPFVFGKGENGFAGSFKIENVMKLAGIESKPSKEVLEELPVYRITLSPANVIDQMRSFSGIHSLNIDENKIESEEHPMVLLKEPRYNTLKAASEHLGGVLSESVRNRVSGLEDLGMWLSGGVDSSLLVALSRKYFSGKIRTIFVTFKDYERNYREYALEVARKFETDHSEVVLDVKDYLNLWAETIHIIQEPVNSPGAIGQVAALEKISPSVEAFLIGEGADTIFGGPYWAPMLCLSYLGQVLPQYARSYFKNLSKKIKENNFWSTAISKSLKAVGTPIQEYIHSEIVYGREEEIDTVFRHGTWHHVIEDFKKNIRGDMLTDMVLFMILNWLTIWNGPLKRISFHFEVPYVFPFLDYDLMRNSMRLPLHLRYHYSTKKAALKKYAENFFDRKFIYKPKEGFGIPFRKWFSMAESLPFLNLPLEERSLKRGWWNETELKKIINLHKGGYGTDKSAETIPWITVNLELWARICLEGDSPDLYKV